MATVSPISLEYLCFRYLRQLLAKFFESKNVSSKKHYEIVREYLDHLPPATIEAFLKKFFNVDPWTNPCGARKDKAKCFYYSNCKLVYQSADRIMKTLFFSHVTHLDIHLFNFKENIENEVIRAIEKVMSDSGTGCRLRTLLLKGSRSKDSVKLMTNFCETLTRCAPCLENLHIPVLSDKSAQMLSMLEPLKKLTAEHLRKFSPRGLYSLCRNSSKTVNNLEELTIPLRTNNPQLPNAKYHLMVLLTKMKSLKVLHSYSSQAVSHLTALGLPYSALKMALICHKSSYVKDTLTTFSCKLTDLIVPYGSFKPLYILSTCPDLVSLSIVDSDSGNPNKEWLSKLFESDDWSRLAIKLKYLSLHITLESFHIALSTMNNGVGQIFEKLPNLKKLHIVCSTQNSPASRVIYISDILRVCPQLKELKVEADGVLMNGIDAANPSLVHNSLTTFCWSVSTADANSEHCLEQLVLLMPNLRVLEISSWELETGMFSNHDVVVLRSLKYLQKLAISLEKESFVGFTELSNYLFKFPSLRNLLLWKPGDHKSEIENFVYVKQLSLLLKARNSNLQVKCDRRWKEST